MSHCDPLNDTGTVLRLDEAGVRGEFTSRDLNGYLSLDQPRRRVSISPTPWRGHPDPRVAHYVLHVYDADNREMGELRIRWGQFAALADLLAAIVAVQPMPEFRAKQEWLKEWQLGEQFDEYLNDRCG